MLIVPALYAAPDSLLQRLNHYVKNGGHIVYTFKSGFSDENVKVRTTIQPGIINEACGITYSQFTIPQNVSLKGDPFKVGAEKNKVNTWMELITPTTAKVLAYYDHPVWGSYAAITQNEFGKGLATYIGCMTSKSLTENILKDILGKTKLWKGEQQLSFPIISKSGVNMQGKTIRYYFNYSNAPMQIQYLNKMGTEIISNTSVSNKRHFQNWKLGALKLLRKNKVERTILEVGTIVYSLPIFSEGIFKKNIWVFIKVHEITSSTSVRSSSLFLSYTAPSFQCSTQSWPGMIDPTNE